MHEEVLQEIRPSIRIALQEILGSAREAGWIISRVRWQDLATRTLEFTAINPKSCENNYVMCHEDDIAERLRSMLRV